MKASTTATRTIKTPVLSNLRQNDINLVGGTKNQTQVGVQQTSVGIKTSLTTPSESIPCPLSTRERTAQCNPSSIVSPTPPATLQEYPSDIAPDSAFGSSLHDVGAEGDLTYPSVRNGGTLQISGATPPIGYVASNLNQGLQPLNGAPSQAAVPTDGDLDGYTFPSDQSITFGYDTGGLVWEDIDLGDLNSYFFDPFLPPDELLKRLPQAMQTGSDPEQRADATNLQQKRNAVATIVEQLWFTRLESDSRSTLNPLVHTVSGDSTPRGGKSAREDINEIYRLSLSNRLRPQYSEEPLPSTDFLVSGVLDLLDGIEREFGIG
jgi:hypothetical protein